MATDYGQGDSTYQALGGFEGISKLVNCFYEEMANNQDFHKIDIMHSEPEQLKRDKLIYFLCGWTGGPENYSEHFGRTISMPGAHAHLDIDEEKRDMWLHCMKEALIKQDYPIELKAYMIQALGQPAEVIRRISEQMKAKRNKV